MGILEAIGLAGLFGPGASSPPAPAWRLQRISSKIDLLLKRFEVDVPRLSLPESAARRLQSGDKIGAVRAYREETCSSIMEAKAAIEGGGHAVAPGIEQKLDLLLNKIGLTYHDDGMEQVVAIARSGNKIQAIKRHREMTGSGLAEAKAAVEGLLANSSQ